MDYKGMEAITNEERADRDRQRIMKRIMAGNVDACREYLEKYGGAKWKAGISGGHTGRDTRPEIDRLLYDFAAACIEAGKDRQLFKLPKTPSGKKTARS